MTKFSEVWTTIVAVLECNAARFGSRPALLGEGGVRLSHRELHAQVTAMVQALNHLGIRRGDRVALIIPQGPDLAVAFLAVASGANSAPLNPAYFEREFEFHLRDLSAKALILLRGSESPARAAAAKLNVPIVELDPLEEGGGIFGLSGGNSSAETAPIFAESDDIALVLHTSGTTSRPQRVPLSHANLAAFKVLLYRYTGQADVLVGVPIANRQHPEVEPLIGLFAKTLAMRSAVSGEATFEELLDRVKETALEAYEHQDMPFELLVRLLQVRRYANRTPLLQVTFALRDFPEINLQLAGVEVIPFAVSTHTSKFDLSLAVTLTSWD